MCSQHMPVVRETSVGPAGYTEVSHPLPMRLPINRPELPTAVSTRGNIMPSQSLDRGRKLAIGLFAAVLFAATFSLERRTRDVGDPDLNAALASVKSMPEPAASRALTRIAVGSCLRQNRPAPIFDDVLAVKPELLLMIGDNVYGDFKGDDASPLKNAYVTLARHADFNKARAQIAVLPVWDDHDYGLNDGGSDFKHKTVAGNLFHQFWGRTPERSLDDGIHYSRIYGPTGQRVQIIMLDTRSFRSPLRLKSPDSPLFGKFEPDTDPAKTILGERQWAWLATELQKPAEVRLIVSSIQALAEGHGWERWGNLPRERQRLIDLLSTTRTGALIILSGDRHSGAFYATSAAGRDIVELTASSFNAPPPPNKDARVPPLASDIVSKENFGLAEIDWGNRTVLLSLRGLNGESYGQRPVKF